MCVIFLFSNGLYTVPLRTMIPTFWIDWQLLGRIAHMLRAWTTSKMVVNAMDNLSICQMALEFKFGSVWNCVPIGKVTTRIY